VIVEDIVVTSLSKVSSQAINQIEAFCKKCSATLAPATAPTSTGPKFDFLVT
ncbi:unnamed protein product, partial [Acidithrix sp. C25]